MIPRRLIYYYYDTMSMIHFIVLSLTLIDYPFISTQYNNNHLNQFNYIKVNDSIGIVKYEYSNNNKKKERKIG